MKFLKILLGILVTLAVLFVIGGMLLPSEQHVERSVVVNVSPAKVFSLVNDYREFNKWSPGRPSTRRAPVTSSVDRPPESARR